ncbi:MAG: hypothetical protein ACRDY2_01825 [Acidimicrobiales bacterium]
MRVARPSRRRTLKGVGVVLTAAALVAVGLVGVGHKGASSSPRSVALNAGTPKGVSQLSAALHPAPAGTPAPKAFASTLDAIYANAVSYAGLPGRSGSGKVVTTTAPMSTQAFSQLVKGMSRGQLAKVYDASPTGWAHIGSTLASVHKTLPPTKLASDIADAYAAKATTTAVPPKAAPRSKEAPPAKATAAVHPTATANLTSMLLVTNSGSPPSYTPPPPKVFNAPTCPNYSLGTDDGYDLLFGLTEAADIAVGLAGVYLVGIVAAVVALALQASVDTVNLLINLYQQCQTVSSDQESVVVDGNVINLDNTTIAIIGLDNLIQVEEDQIYALLDSRTQTIINKLNVAQHSLDQAQMQAIEEALAGGSGTAIASYELPASLGGWLDSTPIGVQAIVTNAVSSLEQAHQPVSSSAAQKLTSANTALASGQYKQAFFDYQAAYQALNH